MKTGQWTEIFRAGDYGDKGKYSEGDLDTMVANFNSQDQVPIVVGHPATDAPAWGWLSAVQRVGDVLQGKVGELHGDFARALSEKKFRNRSVRIARTAAGPKLLHLGFLGAVLPEVEGLKTAAFAGDGERLDYAFDLPGEGRGDQQTEDEEMEKDEKIRKLMADLAAEKAARAAEKTAADEAAAKMRAAEFARFVDNEMIAAGKIAKGRRDEAIGFLSSLPATAAADFSVEADGAKKSYNPVEWFKDFIKGLPAADFTQDLPADGGKDGGREFNRDDQGKLIDLTGHV